MSSGFITCTLSGGIGNQLFQIAHAFSLSKALNLELMLSFNQFSGCGQGSHPSKYYSSFYNKLNVINKLLPVSTYVQEAFFTYDPKIKAQLEKVVESNKNAGINLSGNFQSEFYFLSHRNEIKNLFIPSGGVENFLKHQYPTVFQKFIKLFSTENLDDRCYIGVRRGDFMENANFHLPCGIEYYKEAIEKIGNDKQFYIATDDIDWCKTNFKGDNFVFFELTDDLPQLLLAMLFKFFIISNSTFHWWGSYLSLYNDKRVIAPDRWINQYGYESVYREDMEILTR
uniref:Glycosyltransferase n=1 Tax=viral metagenome TaxID=1070528 RepID=A0A6C0KTM9_9ZZZZ